MILSGATGVLQKIDITNRTITLVRRSGAENYEYEASYRPERWTSLVGKMVSVHLCDFLVIDVSENPDITLVPNEEERK
jgi:hypothetical protein